MRAALAMLFAMLACGERDRPEPASGTRAPAVRAADAGPGPVARPTTDGALTAPTPAAIPPRPAIADLALPPGVPPLAQADVDAQRKPAAQALNRRGLARLVQGDHAGAIELYEQALSIDPGHLLVRYNLSCAYNLAGRTEHGLAILRELRELSCADCRRRLERAAEDAEWQSAWSDPRFVELVAVDADEIDPRPWWERDDPCPRGTTRRGSEGDEIYCARASGARHGRATRWQDGTLADQGSYDGGRKHGMWLVFDADGALAESGMFRRGARHGPWSEWYPSGAQAADGTYRDDRKDGSWTRFTEDGSIAARETWRGGVRE